MRRSATVVGGTYAFDGSGQFGGSHGSDSSVSGGAGGNSGNSGNGAAGELGRDGLQSGWHFHDIDQIQYAFHGTAEVETAESHYLLPPAVAAWIPAGLPHRTKITNRVRTMSVFLEPNLVPASGQ